MKKYFAKAFLGLCALGTSTVANCSIRSGRSSSGCRIWFVPSVES